jgi:hypothetical protein
MVAGRDGFIVTGRWGACPAFAGWKRGKVGQRRIDIRTGDQVERRIVMGSIERRVGARGSMDPKPRPNHRLYLQVLARMTPEQHLLKAFELSAFTRALFKEGLRKRFPDLSEEELHRVFLERLARCHNRNY